jgi:hypothetical protein
LITTSSTAILRICSKVDFFPIFQQCKESRLKRGTSTW